MNPSHRRRVWPSLGSRTALLGTLLVLARAASGQQVPASAAAAEPPVRSDTVSVEFVRAPLADVLAFFGRWSGRSLMAGTEAAAIQVSARVTAQPWDQALQAILRAHGLLATELDNGIIHVEDAASRARREALEPLETRAYRISHRPDLDWTAALGGILSARGSVAVAQGGHTLVVTDLQRTHRAIDDLLAQLDVAEPQVHIEARIVFINRTGLDALGVVYDLKDRRGNQLNEMFTGTPAAPPSDAASSADGEVLPGPGSTMLGSNVVHLAGPSIAALGNANARIPGPTLNVLASLVLGRHTLVGFIEALRSHELSDIEAAPSVTVRNHHEAVIQVGERTPLRVLDTAAGGASTNAGGAANRLPQATVQIEETGIILRTTPHVTRDGEILLDLHAERSAPRLAQADAGFVFSTQNARSTVRVRDGETLVIAGLTVTEEQTVISGIPWLMELPWLGGLFRTRRSERLRRDLVILVTPTLVEAP